MGLRIEVTWQQRQALVFLDQLGGPRWRDIGVLKALVVREHVHLGADLKA